MATDPAVQAAHQAWRELANAMESYWDSPSIDETIDVVVAAVTPLIRAQAFTEAADAIEAEHQWSRLAKASSDSEMTFAKCAALVRGLGEETASVDSKIN